MIIWIIILKQNQIKRFIQDLTTNNTRVIEEGQNDRENEVITILDRVLTRERRRGGRSNEEHTVVVVSVVSWRTCGGSYSNKTGYSSSHPGSYP